MKSPVGTTRRYDIQARLPSLADDVAITELVIGEVGLIRTNQGILAQGHFRTQVHLSCDRCLEMFPYSVEVDIEEQFVPVIDVNTGKWLAVEETDSALLIDDHHILDLAEVLRQAIYLGLPMHPVCRPDCEGLCPQCGQDLGEGPCECEDDDVDPRWEALRGLR